MATAKLKKLPCNLLINNLRFLNAQEITKVNLEKARRNKSKKMYSEYQMIQTENGFEEKLVEVEYPITADYVKSFEQSTDYRLDVDNAIANGKGGQNVGDVAFLQELFKMDTEQLKKVANNLSIVKDKLTQVKADSVKEKEKEVKE